MLNNNKNKMLGSLLSSVGGKIGQYFVGGILSTIGRYAGKQLGKFSSTEIKRGDGDYQWHSTTAP